MSTTLASSDKTVGAQMSTQTQDFWLVYSPVRGTRILADALCALYYLPERYKLMVVDGTSKMLARHQDLMGRVQIQIKGTGLHKKATPFAFIYGEDISHRDKTAPAVIVADQPEQYIKSNEWDGFTVQTGNPEALASAVLDIARAKAFVI